MEWLVICMIISSCWNKHAILVDFRRVSRSELALINLLDGEWTFDDDSFVQGIRKVLWTREGQTRYHAPDFYFKREIYWHHCAVIKQTFYLKYHVFVANISWKHNLTSVDLESCVRAGDCYSCIRSRESSLNTADNAIIFFHISFDAKIIIHNCIPRHLNHDMLNRRWVRLEDCPWARVFQN